MEKLIMPDPLLEMGINSLKAPMAVAVDSAMDPLRAAIYKAIPKGKDEDVSHLRPHLTIGTGLASGGIMFGMYKALKSLKSPISKNIPIMAIPASIIAGATTGYFAPELYKAHREGDIKKMVQIGDLVRKNKYKDIEKVSYAIEVDPVLKNMWEGLRVKPGRTFRGKLWSATVKGGTATAGITPIANKIKNLSTDRKDKSGYNYTTFLRNNLLSGDIKPDELGVEDLQSVQRLGMK